MTAVNFFNNQKQPTNLYQKIKKKDEKMHERNNRYRVDHLTKEEEKHALYLLTMAGHYLEGFIDCIDELDNYGVIGKKHNLNIVKEDLLVAQKFFIMEALKQGEEVSLERQNQQKLIENFMQKITKTNLNNLYKIINFAEKL